MSKSVEKYIHHGEEVTVFSELKGTHREHCLCWNGCKHFKPNVPGQKNSENCIMANGLYEFDVKFNLTTPVFECPKFED